MEWYIPFWCGIFPHESFVLLSCISHRRAPVPRWLEQGQCIRKDGNDTGCHRMDSSFTEQLKTPHHQLRCGSWAEVYKKEMPDCRKPVVSPVCFASSRGLGEAFRDNMQTWPLRGLFLSSVSITAGVLQIWGTTYLHGLSVHGHISHELTSFSHILLILSVGANSCLWQQVSEVHYSLWKVLSLWLNQSTISISFIVSSTTFLNIAYFLFSLILLAIPLFTFFWYGKLMISPF